MKRSIRRHHRQRLKNVRKHNQGNFLQKGVYRKPKAVLGCWVNTPRKCSCIICGNPRKFFGKRTFKEERFLCENVEQDWGA